MALRTCPVDDELNHASGARDRRPMMRPCKTLRSFEVSEMCDDKGQHVEQGLGAEGRHQQVRGMYEGLVVDMGAQQDGAELHQG